MAGILAALGSPVLRYIGVGLAILAFISWQRHDAAQEATLVAEAQCIADAEAAAQAERERLERANAATLAEAERRAREAEAEIAQLRSETDALITDLQAEGSSCPIPDDVLRRLRDIQ